MSIPKECRFCDHFEQEGTMITCWEGHSKEMDCDGKDFKLDYQIMQIVHDRTGELALSLFNSAEKIDKIVTEARKGEQTIHTASTLIANECMRIQSVSGELGIILI